MTHESAPATRLVATHCVRCRRPLVDAQSVERGIGPVCSGDGYGKADGDASWPAAVKAAEEAGLLEELAPILDRQDARTACNRVVYAMACAREERVVPRLELLRALGFERLALALEKALLGDDDERPAARRRPAASPLRVPTVTVRTEGDLLVVATENLSDDQFAAYLAAARSTPTRRWVPERKVSTFAASQRSAVWSLLRASCPGATLITERGTSTIPTI